jgi:hypothetical protein
LKLETTLLTPSEGHIFLSHFPLTSFSLLSHISYIAGPKIGFGQMSDNQPTSDGILTDSQHPEQLFFSILKALNSKHHYMSQMRWIYVDDYLRKYHVGLYHGMQSGHVMIHCNGHVVVVDFHVLDTKKYTFYINDELFDIHLERTNDRFGYSLEIDERTETPRNIIRRKRNRTELITTAAGAATFIGIVASMIYIFS